MSYYNNKTIKHLVLSSAALSCTANQDRVDPILEKLEGTISYPFEATQPLGEDTKSDRFIIKTSTGTTQYVVEIPHGGQDYDIVVPLAKLGAQGLDSMRYKDSDAVITDKEMISRLPSLENKNRTMTALLDKAYGVGKATGPTQSPSYTLSLVSIKKHYKNRNFELALIELNKLLSFYPTSSQLYKMKGSIFVKLRQLRMAEESWIRAYELKPTDSKLKKGILRLQSKIKKEESIDTTIPVEVTSSSSEEKPENLLSH